MDCLESVLGFIAAGVVMVAVKPSRDAGNVTMGKHRHRGCRDVWQSSCGSDVRARC